MDHKTIQHSRKGLTLAELIVVMGIMTVLLIGGYLVLLTGQNAWSITDTQIQLQENSRLILQRISKELQESGKDKNDVLQVTIGDNTGVNATDTLRFSIPVCVCSSKAMDASGDIAYWGAPLQWSRTKCLSPYPVESNGKITICDVTDPLNPLTMQVDPPDVDGHLAHGDWVGACTPCSTDNTKYIEYRINAQGRLLRRVLNLAGTTVQEEVFAENITNFQASLNGSQDTVTLTVTLFKNSNLNRPVTVVRSLDIPLRNAG